MAQNKNSKKDQKKVNEKSLTLTTEKMPGERERPFTAWRLYYLAGSIQKTLDTWDRVEQSLGDAGASFAKKLGKKPSMATIKRWSIKFQWVKRNELKLAETLAGMDKEVKEIDRDKVWKVLRAFKLAWDKVLKQLEQPAAVVTAADAEKFWKMVRVELGQTLGKQELDVLDERMQTPPTEKDKQFIKEVAEATSRAYDRDAKN